MRVCMKKIIIVLIFIFGLVLPCISVNANTNIDKYNEEDTYKIDYELDREMRAVWISPLVNDIPRFTSETQYKNAILDVFKNMEKFNLNTMIFHVEFIMMHFMILCIITGQVIITLTQVGMLFHGLLKNAIIVAMNSMHG